METVELGAQPRTEEGKGPCRRLRAAGNLPATFYGPKQQPRSIAVDVREFTQKVLRLEGSHLIRFHSTADDLAGRVALVKETQIHPVSGACMHADFYEVDMARKITVRVPLHFTGRAAGIPLGGILQPIRREVEVECLPGDIPEFIDVDVTPLGIHDSFHVSQLKLPSGVSVLYESDFALVSVLPPTVEETKPSETTEEVAGAAESTKAEAEKKGGAA